jgi:DNA-directed RNA polymerase subunit RPC12/RpoP
MMVINLGIFDKKYKCTNCSASFKSQDLLMQHSKTHMQASQPASFACQACGISFQTQAEFQQHKQSVHRM